MKNDAMKLKTAILLLGVSSFSLILTIWGDRNGNAFGVLCANLMPILFWGLMIAGYAVFAVLNKSRKANENGKRARRQRPGVICFFQNPLAAAADTVAAGTLILSIIFLVLHDQGDMPFLAFAAVCVFCLHMHGILNGVNYKYVTDMRKGE